MPSRVALSCAASGVAVSMIVTLGSALWWAGRLSGWLPFAVGAVGGLVAVPVLLLQLLALHVAGRPRPILIGTVIPWIVAPVSLAVLVGSVQRLAAGPASRSFEVESDGCDLLPDATELLAGRWSFDPEAAAGPTLRFAQTGDTTVAWVLVHQGRASGASIVVECQ